MKAKNGFTLVEMLVVISIISILAVIGMSIYQPVVKRSRDSKRISDIKFIQSALEQYHADQIYYPSQSQLVPGSPLTNPAGTRTYLTTIPKDPSAGNPQYLYQPSPSGCSGNNCKKYCLYAKMEGAVPASDLGSSDCPASGSYNYGVTRP